MKAVGYSALKNAKAGKSRRRRCHSVRKAGEGAVPTNGFCSFHSGRRGTNVVSVLSTFGVKRVL